MQEGGWAIQLSGRGLAQLVWGLVDTLDVETKQSWLRWQVVSDLWRQGVVFSALKIPACGENKMKECRDLLVWGDHTQAHHAMCILAITPQLGYPPAAPRMCLKCCETSLAPYLCAYFGKKALTVCLGVCRDLCHRIAKVGDGSHTRWCPRLIFIFSLSGWNICNVYTGQNK